MSIWSADFDGFAEMYFTYRLYIGLLCVLEMSEWSFWLMVGNSSPSRSLLVNIA
jgi:hypothetical protein